MLLVEVSARYVPTVRIYVRVVIYQPYLLTDTVPGIGLKYVNFGWEEKEWQISHLSNVLVRQNVESSILRIEPLQYGDCLLAESTLGLWYLAQLGGHKCVQNPYFQNVNQFQIF